jgi:hypothetical protein
MSQSDIFLANILTLIILRASTMGPCGSIRATSRVATVVILEYSLAS